MTQLRGPMVTPVCKPFARRITLASHEANIPSAHHRSRPVCVHSAALVRGCKVHAAGVAARVAPPATSGFPALVTQARDLGRVDLLAGLERLDDAYLAYGALRSAYRGRAGLEKAALDLIK